MNKKFFILILLLFNFNLFSSETETIKFERPVPENVKLIQGYGFYKKNINESFNLENTILSSLYIYSPDLTADLNSLYIKNFPEGKVLETWFNKPFGHIPNKYKDLISVILFIEAQEYIFINNKIKRHKKYKKEGGILLYYGPNYYGRDNYKEFGTLLVRISGIIPLVKKNYIINKNTNLARFATYKEFGYDPLVIIQFMFIDEKENKILSLPPLLPNE